MSEQRFVRAHKKMLTNWEITRMASKELNERYPKKKFTTEARMYHYYRLAFRKAQDAIKPKDRNRRL